MAGIPFKRKEEYMQTGNIQERPEPTVADAQAQRIAELEAQLAALQQQPVPPNSIAAEQLELLKAFAQELRRPDPETEQKRAEDRARREQERKNMLELALLEEEQKRKREENCRHVKENGRSARVGQIHSDGMVHEICQHCFKAFTPYKPSPEQMSMGIG